MGKDGLFKKWEKKLRHKFGRKLDPNHATFHQALQWFEDRRGGYEEMIDAISTYIPRTGVVFDVGANIGFFSKVMVEKTGFKGDVYLFEPVANLSAISREVMKGAACKTHVMSYGLGDHNGAVPMHTSKNGNIGWSTFISEQASPGMDVTTVKIMAFDRAGIKARPSFIKIDVEGSEYMTIRGMFRSLARWKPKPVIFCELSWGKKHPRWKKQLNVFGRLIRMGYGLFKLDGTKIGLEEVHEEPVTTDYLFLPRGRRFGKVHKAVEGLNGR
jgi:FkbM family methyltransferase